MKALTIGKLSRLTNVTIETIRYYERQGLITPAARSANGYRHFDKASVDRLRFIQLTKELGLSLADARELLQVDDAKGRVDVRTLRRLSEKLDALDQQLRALQHFRDVLSAALETLRARTPRHSRLSLVSAALDTTANVAATARANT